MGLKMKYNERGHEILDPTPVEMPVRFHRPPTLQEQIKAFVQRELSTVAEAQGVETFEDADDFDVPDDPIDPTTPWELNYEQESSAASDLYSQADPGAPGERGGSDQASKDVSGEQHPHASGGSPATGAPAGN